MSESINTNSLDGALSDEKIGEALLPLKREGQCAPLNRREKRLMKEIVKIEDLLMMPLPVREKAHELFESGRCKTLFSGRPRRASAGAVVLAAAKAQGAPLKLWLVERAAGNRSFSKKNSKVMPIYRLLVKELSIRTFHLTPENYVNEIVRRIAETEKVEFLANLMLGEVRKAVREGRHYLGSPEALAGAVVYAASGIVGISVSAGEVAAASRVSTGGLGNRYRELKILLDFNNPDKIRNYVSLAAQSNAPQQDSANATQHLQSLGNHLVKNKC